MHSLAVKVNDKLYSYTNWYKEAFPLSLPLQTLATLVELYSVPTPYSKQADYSYASCARLLAAT